jgi:hypothetical protein
MKRFTLLLILLSLSAVTWGESRATFYLYSLLSDRGEFLSAFALEPTCHGIVSNSTGDYRVHYRGSNTIIHKSVPLFFGYIVNPKNGSEVDFSGKSVQTAVRQVCFIIKGNGGTIQ